MPWPTKKSFDDKDKLFLEVDKVVKVQIMENEPHLYYTHFVNNKSAKCMGSDCPMCIAGERQNEKGHIKVVDLSDGKTKDLTGTAALFLAMKETFDMCGGRTGFIFSMKATGEKSQRRYHIVPLPIGAKEAPRKAEEDDVSLPF